MPVFQDPRRTAPFVLVEDRAKPSQDQVTFQLGVLTDSQWASVVDLTSDGRDLWEGTFGLALLREGLRGWSGPGAPPFAVDAAGRPTSAALSQLTPSAR